MLNGPSHHRSRNSSKGLGLTATCHCNRYNRHNKSRSLGVLMCTQPAVEKYETNPYKIRINRLRASFTSCDTINRWPALSRHERAWARQPHWQKPGSTTTTHHVDMEPRCRHRQVKMHGPGPCCCAAAAPVVLLEADTTCVRAQSKI